MTGTDSNRRLPLKTHMDSRHLRWARTFASLIAYTQERDELRPPDLIAGIYTANFERVVRFWTTPDLFEDFVAEHCGWSEPRWLTWQRLQHEVLHPPRKFHLPFTSGWLEFRSFRGKQRRHFFGYMFKPSADWKRLFEIGEGLSPHKVNWQGSTLPLLTPELMLLSVTKAEDMVLSKQLLDSGLMLTDLVEAINRPLENPERFMF